MMQIQNTKSLFIKYITLFSLMLLLSSCGIKKLKSLANCEFKLNKVNKITVAGVGLNPNGPSNLSFGELLKISSAYSNGNIPVDVGALLDIKNPNSTMARMIKFDWKLNLKGKNIANGTVNNEISVPKNSEVTTELATKFDLYKSIGDFSLTELKDGVQNAFDGDGNPKDLKIYIKPYMSLGKLDIPYPGYIEITKHFKSE